MLTTSLLLWNSVAQACTPADIDGFRCVQYVAGGRLYVGEGEGDDMVKFRFQSDGGGFASIGFSGDGMMAGSEAVIGDGTNIKSYSITQKTLSGVSEAALDWFSADAASTGSTDGRTFIEFTRKKDGLTSAGQYVLHAVNPDATLSTLAKHTEKGNVKVQLKPSCITSTRTGYACQLETPVGVIHYSLLDADKQMKFALVSSYPGYAALGFNDKPQMIGTSVVVGQTGTNAGVISRNLTEKAAAGIVEVTHPWLTASSVTTENGNTVLEFTRTMDNIDILKTVVMYAVHETSGDLQYHSKMGGTLLPFDEGMDGDDDDNDSGDGDDADADGNDGDDSDSDGTDGDLDGDGDTIGNPPSSASAFTLPSVLITFTTLALLAIQL